MRKIMYFIKPKFWDKKNYSFLSIILYPLSIIYYIALLIKKKFISTKKFSVPIICIGNIYIGGTGKTSAAIEVFKILNKLKKTCFLTSGYGRTNNKDIYLDKLNYEEESLENTGDESRLLNQFGNVYISNNRAKAINLIKNLGYEIIVLDDGFQDSSVYKDINILCFDSKNWIGNGQLIPAGPLREPVSCIKNADFLIIKGENNEKIEKEAKKINPNINILRMENKIENIEILKNKTYVAFCGIGNPDNFFETLENHNIKIKKKIIYPDHFNFSEKNYEFLFNEAKNNNCELITTEKDYIRINPENKNKIYYTKLSNTLIGNELLTTKLYKLFK